MIKEPVAWLAAAADGSESSAVYMLKEQAETAAREWGWFIAPLYAFPALWPEDEIAIEAAWERTGLKPAWPEDEPGSPTRYARAMADEIGRLRLTDEERVAINDAVYLCGATAGLANEQANATAWATCAATLRGLLERLGGGDE